MPTLLLIFADPATSIPSFSWVDILLSQGPAGLLAAAFAAAAWSLWKENKEQRANHRAESETLRKEHAAELDEVRRAAEEERKALLQKIEDLGKARLDDAKGMTSEMLKLSERVHETTDKLADRFDAAVAIQQRK